MRRALQSFLLIAASLAGCGGLPLTPVTNDRRTPAAAHDASKTLTLMRAMSFEDRSPPTEELRLPAGTYALEAQDNEYWYLRSGSPLDIETFKQGGHPETRHFAGGIMLGKYSFRAVPAGAYIDGEGGARILVWKLAADFIGREGKDWKKSF